MLEARAEEIAQLKDLIKNIPEAADYDDIKLLRFVEQNPGDPGAAAANVQEVVAWRKGDGKEIVEKAAAAVTKAQEGGGWNNDPVLAAAPNSDKIKKFITPKQMLVVSTKEGDIVTCIQAATIDSEELMKEVTEKEMVDFFIYAREVNTIIADARTKATGHFTKLIAANDLTGVSKFPDKDFQAALTGSAKLAVTLYPGYSGPTVLLNLPWVARMLVQFLAPLFPGAVRDKLKFARGPMSYLKDLTDVLKEPIKSNFIDDLESVLST